uniref:Putative secreted protein n=1 Tax=Ixodes ricinus TaxID=34613 RepID=A0A6B0UB88_IXORI
MSSRCILSVSLRILLSSSSSMSSLLTLTAISASNLVLSKASCSSSSLSLRSSSCSSFSLMICSPSTCLSRNSCHSSRQFLLVLSFPCSMVSSPDETEGSAPARL